VDVLGAGASSEDVDMFFDRCLKVVHHIYTSLQLHTKYVCSAYLLNSVSLMLYRFLPFALLICFLFLFLIFCLIYFCFIFSFNNRLTQFSGWMS